MIKDATLFGIGLLAIFILVLNKGYSQSHNLSKCENYNYFLTDMYSNTGDIFHYSKDDISLLSFQSNFSGSDIDSMGGLNGVFKVGPNYSFQYTHSNRSIIDENLYYGFYQQYYKGVKIDGGETVISYFPSDWAGGPGPIGPCDRLHDITPNVFSSVNINTVPQLDTSNIKNLLEINNLLQAELAILPNLENECDYKLIWKIEYLDSTLVEKWIDANSGEILNTIENQALSYLKAPTSHYHNQDLNDYYDEQISKTILETPPSFLNGTKLRVYDVKSRGVVPADYSNAEEFYNALKANMNDEFIPKTSNSDEWTNEATRFVYQSFFACENILKVFNEELQMQLRNIHITHAVVDTDEEVISHTFNVANVDVGLYSKNDVFVQVANNEFHSSAIFDVLGHEIAHAFLRKHLNRTKYVMHEALADIYGIYAKHKIWSLGIPGVYYGNLWELGDEDGSMNVMPGWRRDFTIEATVANNSIKEIPEHLKDYYRGRYFRYIFYLTSVGNASKQIPEIGIDKSLKIFHETLIRVPSRISRTDFMNALLETALKRYGGICSREFQAFVWAIHATELPIPEEYKHGSRLTGEPYSCNLNLKLLTSTCEENNYLKICVEASNDIAGNIYTWTINDPKGVYFTMNGDNSMSNSITTTDGCLELTNFPKFDYYPHYIDIKVTARNNSQNEYGQRTATRSIKIIDCNGDDCTCEQYYNNEAPCGKGYLPLSSYPENRKSGFLNNTIKDDYRYETESSNNDITHIKIYNLMGMILMESTNREIDYSRYKQEGIIFIAYYNKNKLLRVEKKLIIPR